MNVFCVKITHWGIHLYTHPYNCSLEFSLISALAFNNSLDNRRSFSFQLCLTLESHYFLLALRLLFLIYCYFSTAFLGLGLWQNSAVINNVLLTCPPPLDVSSSDFLFPLLTVLAFFFFLNHLTLLWMPQYFTNLGSSSFIFHLEVLFTLWDY